MTNKLIITVLLVFTLAGFTGQASASGASGTGDVNGDGTNIVDALFIAQYTVGTRTLTSTELAAADVNGDGMVTIVDALFIAQYTVGSRALTGAVPLISPVAANPDPVSVGSVTLAPGSFGMVAINVTSVTTDIAAATVTLTFNPAIVAVQSVSAGDFITGSGLAGWCSSSFKAECVPTTNIGNGTVTISVFNPLGATTAPVTIANVVLQGVAGATLGATSALTLTVNALSDSNGVNRVPGIGGITNGIATVTIATPTPTPTPTSAALTLKGSYNTAGSSVGVAVAGNYAYVADGSNGLVIVDVTNPAAPTLKGGYDTAGDSKDVAVAGKYAYVADGSNGLVIVDVTNPAAPTLKGSYNTAGDSWGVALAGNYAYVADDSNGLVIVDVTNPAAPALKGSYNTPGQSNGVAVAGNNAYVADGKNGGLVIIDVSNPAAPTLKGSYTTNTGNAWRVAVAGNYAYVANGGQGLMIVDVSNPAAPTLKGSYATAGKSIGVAVAGNYAYVADLDNGLVIVDVSNPAAPTLKDSYNTAGISYGVAVAGNYAYVADGDNGLLIFQLNTTPVSVLTTITVSPISATVGGGNKQTFNASPKDQYGNPITATITWSSNNPSVGTISSAGVFTAVAAGTTTITATSGSVSESATVTVIVTSGLVGDWHFDGSASDSSGNGNHGTINGATFVQGVSGQALSFDGVDDMVVVPHSSSLSLENYTMEAWIKRNQNNESGITEYILVKRYEPSWMDNYGLSISSNGTVGAGSYSPDIWTWFGVESKKNISAGNWYHIVATYDRTTLKIYINGVLDNSVNTQYTPYQNNYQLVIGRGCVGDPCMFKPSSPSFNGTIDEVRIYNRALSASEIQASYNAISSVPALTTIAISPVSASIAAGSIQIFTATPKDQNGNAIAATVTWSSSNTSVGTISSSTGVFTALKAGTTTITATSGSVSGTATVTVQQLTTGLVVSISNTTATTNSNITQAIMIKNANNLAAATIWLTYDPNVVNVLSVSAGDLNTVTSNIDNAIGKTTITSFSNTGNSGNVTFANLLLKAVGQINASSPLTISVQALTDPNGNSIPYTIKSGTFAISTTMKGDVSGDNQVTVVDALFVSQYTVGLRTLNSQQLAAADVNGDGQVTVVDALFIAQYTVGLRQL